jgi:hypothetical protein
MTVSPDELQALVQGMARERRKTTVESLGVRSTLWLAAAPLWTRSAAENAGFPLQAGKTVTDFVRDACDAGWCETRGSLQVDGPTELRFWMPDEVRRDVLDVVRERPGGDLQIVREAQRVATGVASSSHQADLPGALRAWAELCVNVQREKVPGQLTERVLEAVRDGDLGRAQELVAAGEALEPVVAGEAKDALDRARQLLGLGLHQRTNERALRRYLDRPELTGAVGRLLDQGTDQWALHVRGVGGVGKTMLIRYLKSGRFAQDRRLAPIPMASVNFDHISPDYPIRKPVQLLLELADELALYTAVSHRATVALKEFRSYAEWAHQAVSGVREATASSLKDPRAVRAIERFAEVINELGGVLLILDTCEELTKWDAGNPDSLAIQATLEIVERVRERTGSVRVLFAGRRPLPARGYLAVQDVAGFTVQEARRYLASFGDRALTGELADEMIRQSHAIDEPVPRPGTLPARVNPFDLALYRAWADEEPGLDIALVARGSDAYIESRIIQRLGSPLVIDSLPLLAVGGKCQIDTIATVLGCDKAELGRRLAEQEWIESSGSSPHESVMAWHAVAHRLRRYFNAVERQEEFSDRTRCFATELLRRLSDELHASADVDADEVITALRLAEPDEAVDLWELTTEWAQEPPGRWGAIGAMTRRILGEWADDGWPATNALRACVLAAYIAAYRRAMPMADVRDLWARVLATAGDHPDLGRQRQLRALGALGSLPYAPQDASLWEVLRDEQECLLGSPEVGTAAIDAIHRLLEAGHADVARHLRELLELDSFRFAFAEEQALSPALAWANVADARLLADSDTLAAEARLEHAERLALAATDPEPGWPHWIPPEDLLARVRIERGLIAPPADPGLLTEWEDYAAGHLDSVDGERLASLCLRIRLRYGVVPTEDAQRWESRDRYLQGRVATNSAHDLVPPLFVSIAEAWLSAGRPDRALALLERRRSEANAPPGDAATVRSAEAAIVRLARRLRLTDQQSLLVRLTSPAEYGSQAARAWIGMLDDARRAWAVIYRDRPPGLDAGLDRLAGWHAWWQCQPADLPEPVPPVPWSPEGPDAERASLAGLADIQADLQEMRLLQRRDLEHVRRQLDARLDVPDQLPPRSLAPARSADPYHDLRLDLRWLALAPLRYVERGPAPRRLFAEMAFDEAELLALRLPSVAAEVYRAAANEYEKCGDHIGRLLALTALLDVAPTSHAAARKSLRDARAAVKHHQQAFDALLEDPPQDAGPWRQWAQAVHRQLAGPAPVPEPGSGASSASSAQAVPPAGDASDGREAAAILRAPREALGILLGLLSAGDARAASRLAAERGIGAVPLAALTFDATVGEAALGGPTEYVRLSVRLRPWQSIPARGPSRVQLMAISLAVRQLQSGWPGQPAGYSGLLVEGAAPGEPGSIRWTPPYEPPADAWWERPREAAVAGTLHAGRDQGAQLWERILAASFGPAAAGRIEWVRSCAGQARPRHIQGSGAQLIAPPAWDRVLGERYLRPKPSADLAVCVRHVIGRAVQASAGPCMDVSGESAARAAPGARLLGVADLTRGRPLGVVLQAEPAGEESSDAVRRDGLTGKLRLATALVDDGVPVVLILPELPVSAAREVSRVVTAFADAPDPTAQDIRVALLRPLREVIERHVEPRALDDVILFLNESSS